MMISQFNSMNNLRLCRFQSQSNDARIGLVTNENSIVDLTAAGIHRMDSLLESDDIKELISKLSDQNLSKIELKDAKLLVPLEQQEVWAAGITYSRSKKARKIESDFSAVAYDRVYSADRPQLFFKSIPEKVVATDESIGIRSDSEWNVPEPELAIIMNSSKKIVGYTIGNDMSSRDIEGENILYQPQAKIYNRSCSIGPWISIGVNEEEARQWIISIKIKRNDKLIYQDEISVSQIKRSFNELVEYLFRSQDFHLGVVLLTGTGVVPDDNFSLQTRDIITINITGIGTLENQVVQV